MTHILPAAAVPEGSVVLLPDADYDGKDKLVTIDHIENSTPRPGKITWIDDEGTSWVIGGNVRVNVTQLP